VVTPLPAIPPRDNPRWRFRRPRWLTRRTRLQQVSYGVPLSTVVRVVYASLRHQQRDPWHDTRYLAARMKPRPLVTGLDHVPASGPCVILPNHYERRDHVWVGWGAIVITAALSQRRAAASRVHWVMTSTWQDCYLGPRRIPPDRLHWLLRRLAQVYGLILMPTAPQEVLGRGEALRAVLRALRDPRGHIVAFHPEAGGSRR
jgi:hypothetical protein